MPPLLANFIHARGCKPKCEKSLTLPLYCRGAENGIKCICIMFHMAEKKISELRINSLYASAVNIISFTDRLFLGEDKYGSNNLQRALSKELFL